MTQDKISATLVKNGLTTQFIGQNLLCRDTITSTMDGARELALKHAPEGAAVFAETQTAGRGRLKRLWLTQPGNIAVSIILYPPKNYLPSLIMLSSLAVKQSLEAFTGLKCRLKWPNDVLINGKKVCGILIETKTQIDKADYAIIGIGINVNLSVADYPEIQATGTSLVEELKQPVDRVLLLQRLFCEMEDLYLTSLTGKTLFPRWREALATLGQPVRARSGDEVYEGIAEGVQEDGSLLLRLADGQLMRFTVGDVTLRA